MESEVILTTEQLRLRKLTPDDLPLLEKSLCDARVMYAYEHGFSRDEALELDNLGRFMQMARDYARAKGFKGAFYLEPKPKEPTKHQYDFDAATCMNFIRTYGLEGDFKLNIEANHATLAGHTFQHELRVASVNGCSLYPTKNTFGGDPCVEQPSYNAGLPFRPFEKTFILALT